MKKLIFIFGLIVLIIVIGFCAKQKFHNPKQQLETEKIEIEEVPCKDVIWIWHSDIDKFYDTIKIYKPTIDTIGSFDSILSNKIHVDIDTLDNHLGFLFDIYRSGFHSEQRIALKRDDKFLLFPILREGNYREIRTEIIHFENDIDFLLIRYSESYGLSDWTHGYADYLKGIEIWNLNKIEMFANFKYLEWEEPPAVESEIFCYSYSFEIKDQMITFTEQNICNDFDERLTTTLENPKKITYKFTEKGLIRVK